MQTGNGPEPGPGVSALRSAAAMLLTLGSGLAGVWQVLEGWLEALTLLVGLLVGVLTLYRQIRELRAARRVAPPSSPSQPEETYASV